MAERNPMPRVKLGRQGLEVSKLGYGCMGITGAYNDPLPEEDGIAIIKEAFNKGITHFDTSNLYGKDSANEYLVGKALKQLPREKVELATKFGVHSLSPLVVIKGSPDYVRSCCEASLRRLQVEYIDLYYIHRVDTSVPIEETVGELKKLVEEGKIRYIGLSEASADTIRRAHAVHPISAYQLEYSLGARDLEDEIIPLCRELGIGIVAYSPIGCGFFGGKKILESLPMNTFLNINPRYTGENWEKNKIFFFRVDSLAKKHGCTPAQLALAWVHHQGDDVVSIPGTTKITNLHENIGSLNIKLTCEDVKELSKAVPMDEVAGNMYDDSICATKWWFANTPRPTPPPLLEFDYVFIGSQLADGSVEHLGSGGSSVVYAGRLNVHEQNILVAMKCRERLNTVRSEWAIDRQFEREKRILSELRDYANPNIIHLIGSSRSALVLNARANVYEIMPAGSLELNLHENAEPLNWTNQMKIALGVAKGLRFLHQFPIIHRDLKSGNILLDQCFSPKVSDFGLALDMRLNAAVYGGAVVEIGTKSAGYYSNEYRYDRTSSTFSDVYSFGILLIELVTGMVPWDQKSWRTGQNWEGITQCVPAVPGELIDLVYSKTLQYGGHGDNMLYFVADLGDPKLQGNILVGEFVQVVRLALKCARANVRDRLTMANVVSILEEMV